MIKSMTGFSKNEANEKGVTAIVEIRSLNGRYLEMNIRMPRGVQHKEFEIREIIRKNVGRGSLNVNVNLEYDSSATSLTLNTQVAQQTYDSLNVLKKELKIRETVKMEHLLQFSNLFMDKEENDDEALIMRVIRRALNNALHSLDVMKKNEGSQILTDIQNRIQGLEKTTKEIEDLGIKRIPEERERLRQRIAQLFESDEIDEQRLQTEMVLLADKLDISEECVRLRSHINFFNEQLKSKQSEGRKINFLLQEMHREVNTIGSKINDAKISQLVVEVQAALERIREQIQNIE